MLKKTFRLYRDHYVALLRLGVPIMIGQLGIIIVGFADNMMVGHHTSEELAAASFVNNLFNLPLMFALGFCYLIFSDQIPDQRSKPQRKA